MSTPRKDPRMTFDNRDRYIVQVFGEDGKLQAHYGFTLQDVAMVRYEELVKLRKDPKETVTLYKLLGSVGSGRF